VTLIGCLIAAGILETTSWNIVDDKNQQLKVSAAVDDDLHKMFSCAVCDTLIEDVYRELQRDMDKSTVKGRRDSIGTHGSHSTMLELRMGPNVTIHRMLHPTLLSPGCAEWDGYTDTFRLAAQHELEGQKIVFSNIWKGISIKTVRSHVTKLKHKLCSRACEENAARWPELPDTGCGRCMEVMRDLGMLWVRSRTRDAPTAWQMLGQVCEDMDLRHDSRLLDEIQGTCDEVVEEHGRPLVHLLELSTTHPSVAATPETTTGFLAQGFCVQTANMCSAKEMTRVLDTFASTAKQFMQAGGHAAKLTSREL